MLEKFEGLKHTQKIMTKMCEVVGANVEEIDFKSALWFTRYNWSEKDQENFTNWLSEYLMNSGEARRELMAIPKKSKRMTDGVARNFVFNYGWKLND